MANFMLYCCSLALKHLDYKDGDVAQRREARSMSARLRMHVERGAVALLLEAEPVRSIKEESN